MYELYDVYSFFKGYKTKILKSVSPQVKKDMLKVYDELLEKSIVDKCKMDKWLDELLAYGCKLKISYCTSYYGIKDRCFTLGRCVYYRKYAKDVITRHIKQPGNEKYLPLIKRRKKK